jgi:formate dehydrogenase maturation protein FdhE
MDPINFYNSIRNITSSLHCPSCGGGYMSSEIKLHAKNEDGLVFAANCLKCNLPVWVNVVTKGFHDGELFDVEPISIDEVINFHLLVKDFDGDFRKAFL